MLKLRIRKLKSCSVSRKMAKPFARRFYSSKAWQTCRNEYAKQAHYLCEDCLAKGIYKPGEIVHHIIEIDPVTIDQPEVALNFDNLRLVCRECHAQHHKIKNKNKRYTVGPDGKIFSKKE